MEKVDSKPWRIRQLKKSSIGPSIHAGFDQLEK
jgi:hypothetical protein